MMQVITLFFHQIAFMNNILYSTVIHNPDINMLTWCVQHNIEKYYVSQNASATTQSKDKTNPRKPIKLTQENQENE